MTTHTPDSTSSRWQPVNGGGTTFRRGDAVLTFDGTSVRVMHDGHTWEESFGHPDHLWHHGGFPRILDSWLRTENLPDGAGLEQACGRIEEEVIEAEITAQVRQQEEQLFDAQAKLDDARIAVQRVQEKLPPGSFADRVTSRRVDLVKVIEEGIEPASYIPGSGGTLIVEARHLATAPRKVGKSIAWQATAVRIVLAGGRVVILDRENGGRIYALRLADFISAWKLTPEQLGMVRENLHYYAFPSIRREDREHLAEEWAEFDLVVFDSQRGFQTWLGMKEDSSDDYGEFMEFLIDPLHREGVATLVLHNTGHGNKGRGRGTSSQGDLHDVLLVMKKTEPYFIDTTGEVHLQVDENREGHSGAWTMKIGGGVYEDWTPASAGAGAAKGSRGRKEANIVLMRILLAEDPAMTDEALAVELGVEPKTVGRYRKELTEG